MKVIYLIGFFLLVSCPLLFSQWVFQDDVFATPRFHCRGASTADHALFAGGTKAGLLPVGTVEVYHAEFDNWTSVAIQPRSYPGVVATDSLLFVAGGFNFPAQQTYDIIEIYNPYTDQFSFEALSVPRADLGTAVVGSKVIFAGGSAIGPNFSVGSVFSRVDIYDMEEGTWTIDSLSVARGGMATAANGDVVVFAGGYFKDGQAPYVSGRVDIYDASAGTWSTTELSEPKMYASAVSVGEYILIAGGNSYLENALSSIDMYHVPTNTWTTAELAEARSIMAAGVLGNKAYFAGGGQVNWSTHLITGASSLVEIYDVETGTWDPSVNLGVKRSEAAAATVGNKLIIATGYDPQVGLHNSIDVFTDTTLVSGTLELLQEPGKLLLSPNPASTEIFLETGVEAPVFLQVFSVKGEVLFSEPDYQSGQPVDISGMPAGIYLARASKGGVVWTGRFIKK